MLKNYILTAWKIFLRRKFFTFINLFGISLTLMILLVMTAIFDAAISPKGPEKYASNYLTIGSLAVESEDGRSQWNSSPGYKFLVEHVDQLKAPEFKSYFTDATEAAAYKGDKKVVHQLRRVDANYWRFLDYDFLAGRSFTEEEHLNGQYLAVISKNLRDSYFDTQDVLGKYITSNNQRFQIIGVVDNVSMLEMNAYADIWVSYKTFPSTSYEEQFMDGWAAMLYSSTSAGLVEIQEEFIDIVKNKFKSFDPEEFPIAFSAADSKLDSFAREFTGNFDTYESGADKFIAALLAIILLFMLLPSINMININVSRIIERSGEIGVRKAFGASSKTLVGQFLVENIMLTVIGGFIGFIGTLLILNFISVSGMIPYATFSINLNVLLYSIGIILVFALLSGIYPAWKMSRLHPVQALKGDA